MRRPRGRHERFVELLSAALDEELTGHEQHELSEHLPECGRCRQVRGDLLAQRELLRRLPPSVPPRDLWARTSVILDRELARHRPAVRPAISRGPLLTTAAVLAVSLVLVSAELDVSRQPPSTDSPGVVQPTPFSITGQPLAYLGTSADGVVLYRKQVDKVCPINALGCIVEDTGQPVFIAVPPEVRPQNLSVSPNGEYIAITGRGHDREAVFALSVKPAATPLPTAVPMITPPEDVGPGQQSPPASGSAEPSPPQVAASAQPSLATVTILDDVLTAGAPPAWSADGATLAFSALPADGSHGPDVYLWQAGDERARRLTSDRASYFASWAGNRIVISRVVPQTSEDGSARILTVVHDPASGEERSVAAADLWLPLVSPTGHAVATWQGSMNLNGTQATPLDGALYVTDWSSLDPFSVDARREQSPAPADDEPAPSEPADSPATDDESSGASSDPMITLPPDEDEAETAVPSAGPSAEPSAEPSAGPTGEPSAEPGTDDATDDPTASPGEATPAPSIELIELELRIDDDRLLVDWQVRWSSDATAIGVWVADAPGASWGELAVFAVNSEARAATGQPLVKPMLAGRHFTLGRDRVAWITPADGSLDGEVRVTTWGAGGEGGLRFPSSDLREVVPGF